ncbi:MAG TPA: nitroreductase family protein [Steroidobacteraceae bacterium]|nr:nitroreductase family protein [Steroidobacteraceae bacterium]
MEFVDVVLGRHAVRSYAPTPVPADLIAKLIGLAVHAPSAMNGQPWAFAVANDPQRIDEYASLAKEYYLAHEDVPNTVRAAIEARDHSIFHHAPVLVLVLAKSDTEQAREDCCLAAQTLMLAARDVGLGSCWVGFARPWLNRPETRAQLKLPRGYRVVAPIVMGYPTAWPPAHGRAEPEIRWLR